MATERLLITIDVKDGLELSDYIAAIEKAGRDLEETYLYEMVVWKNNG